jgi:hypothetical protein
VLDALIEGPFNIKSWVTSGDISDNLPIMFQMVVGGEKLPAPFKFNYNWLPEEDYRNLVSETWVHMMPKSPSSFMRKMVDNLRCIKIVLKHSFHSYKEKT